MAENDSGISIVDRVQNNWIEITLLIAGGATLGFVIGSKTGHSRGVTKERGEALKREKREFKRGVIEAKSAIDRVLNDLTLKIE